MHSASLDNFLFVAYIDLFFSLLSPANRVRASSIFIEFADFEYLHIILYWHLTTILPSLWRNLSTDVMHAMRIITSLHLSSSHITLYHITPPLFAPLHFTSICITSPHLSLLHLISNHTTSGDAIRSALSWCDFDNRFQR